MNINNILNAVKSGLAFVENFKPVAVAIGGPMVGRVIEVASTVIAIAENAQARIADGKVAATTNDQKELQSMIDDLAAVNDQFSRMIAES